MESTVDYELKELYDEFKFSEHFSLPISYDDMPAHKLDWWIAFIAMDAEVEAELTRREQAKQQHRSR